MNPEDTIDVLSAIAAYDQRTIGRTDAEAWHHAIGHLDRDLALEAVIIHHKTSTERCKPAHVNGIARGIQRTRVEAENTRQVLNDTRPPGHPPALDGTGLNTVGRPIDAAYEINDAVHLACRTCDAQPGQYCEHPDGRTMRIPHVARLTDANRHTNRRSRDTSHTAFSVP